MSPWLSIDELQAQIQAASEAAKELWSQYAAAKETAQQLSDQFASMSAEAVASQVGEVARLLEETSGIVAQAVNKADEAHTHAEAAKTHLTATASPRSDSLRTVAATASGGLAGFRPDQRHPDAAAAVRRFGWPRGKNGNVRARGLMYDANGKSVLHRPLKALRKGTTYPAPDLKEPWRSDPEMKSSWHIEGGVAAYMRNTGTKEMALYITLPPCGGPARPDPKGCEENLAKILPKGYTLHVHVERENGDTDSFKYPGTGEALL